MTFEELMVQTRQEMDRANWLFDLIDEAMTPSAEILSMEEARESD